MALHLRVGRRRRHRHLHLFLFRFRFWQYFLSSSRLHLGIEASLLNNLARDQVRHIHLLFVSFVDAFSETNFAEGAFAERVVLQEKILSDYFDVVVLESFHLSL